MNGSSSSSSGDAVASREMVWSCTRTQDCGTCQEEKEQKNLSFPAIKLHKMTHYIRAPEIMPTQVGEQNGIKHGSGRCNEEREREKSGGTAVFILSFSSPMLPVWNVWNVFIFHISFRSVGMAIAVAAVHIEIS